MYWDEELGVVGDSDDIADVVERIGTRLCIGVESASASAPTYDTAGSTGVGSDEDDGRFTVGDDDDAPDDDDWVYDDAPDDGAAAAAAAPAKPVVDVPGLMTPAQNTRANEWFPNTSYAGFLYASNKYTLRPGDADVETMLGPDAFALQTVHDFEVPKINLNRVSPLFKWFEISGVFGGFAIVGIHTLFAQTAVHVVRSMGVPHAPKDNLHRTNCVDLFGSKNDRKDNSYSNRLIDIQCVPSSKTTSSYIKRQIITSVCLRTTKIVEVVEGKKTVSYLEFHIAGVTAHTGLLFPCDASYTRGTDVDARTKLRETIKKHNISAKRVVRAIDDDDVDDYIFSAVLRVRVRLHDGDTRSDEEQSGRLRLALVLVADPMDATIQPDARVIHTIDLAWTPYTSDKDFNILNRRKSDHVNMWWREGMAWKEGTVWKAPVGERAFAPRGSDDYTSAHLETFDRPPAHPRDGAPKVGLDIGFYPGVTMSKTELCDMPWFLTRTNAELYKRFADLVNSSDERGMIPLVKEDCSHYLLGHTEMDPTRLGGNPFEMVEWAKLQPSSAHASFDGSLPSMPPSPEQDAAEFKLKPKLKLQPDVDRIRSGLHNTAALKRRQKEMDKERAAAAKAKRAEELQREFNLQREMAVFAQQFEKTKQRRIDAEAAKRRGQPPP